MLKANELRIGNWVLIDELPIKLTESNFFIYLQEDGDFMTRCEGIPITPKILVQFGFKRTPTGDFYLSNFKLNTGHHEFRYGDARSTTKVEYVHHLQNLFFALYYKELNLVKGPLK